MSRQARGPRGEASKQVLRFEDVSFAYRAAPVLSGLTLGIEAGEMSGLLGPNGSGKTTWVRLAAGSLKPSRGRVFLEGRDLAGLGARDRARAVAVVPQESHLAFEFTAGEIVAMGRAPHVGLLGLDSARDRAVVREAMESTEVHDLASRRFTSLSGGERQRVILARSLAQEPRVLLLDEPTAFLDLRHRLSIYELLTRLNERRRITVVIVSHDVDLAARYCRRLVLLRRGRVHAQGSPPAVLTRDHVRDVYGVEAEILDDPLTGRPRVVAIRPDRRGSRRMA